jgi:hypothetical protein
VKVISQYLGYSFRLLSIFLIIYLGWNGVHLAHHLYGVPGLIVGVLLLPLTFLAAPVYQGFVLGTWSSLLGLLIAMPFFWMAGSLLIRWGRIP